MALKRMDNIGIVVDDLDETIEFFRALGLELEGRATVEELATRFERIVGVVRNLGLLAGFCYTQFADTYQEANGLLYADRRPKCPIETIAAATTGAAFGRGSAPALGSVERSEPVKTPDGGDSDDD